MTMANCRAKIPYGRQWIGKEEIRAVTQVLRSDFLTQGPKVAEFENVMAKKIGAKHVIAVANGTAALHLAAISVDLTPDDEVITTPISFLATSNAVLYAGAKPVFADIDPQTQCLDPNRIEKKITPRTKAIFVTDFAGHPSDLIAIRKIAKKHHLKIVEDACHSLGAAYHGFKVGACAHADLTVFSFHPVKHITTGEGGAIATNDARLYDRLGSLRTHGVTRDLTRLHDKKQGAWYYEMHELGFNYRLTDIQAAIGIEQLKKLDRFIARRREIADRYNKAFRGINKILTPVELPGYKHVYHLYVIRLDGLVSVKRAEIFAALHRAGIGAQVHYIPIPSQPYYRTMGYRADRTPNTCAFYESAISLPMFPKMSDRDIDYVINTVRKICSALKLNN